jgi:hypothetical protein
LADLKVMHDLKDSDVDGRTIFGIILRKYGERVWIGFIWFKKLITVGLL